MSFRDGERRGKEEYGGEGKGGQEEREKGINCVSLRYGGRKREIPWG